jgi:uncharacterized tellurite resistance protein B-like protein
MELFGGGLKPNDPRRFLIEAMVGAMSADGVLEPREVAAMEELIRTHPMFRGLPATAAKTLIGLSNDAIDFAGSAVARAPAIAKGLPSRIHRLVAYGMAAEIAVADQVLVEGELKFLEALRIGMRISPLEARQIVSMAQAGKLGELLDDRYSRLRTLLPVAAEVFALRALARATANDDHRFSVRDFFAALPDLAAPSDELDTELFRAFRRTRPADAQVFGELARVAGTLPDPVDRYWMVVYTLVAESPATANTWRVVPFLGVVQSAFQITDTDMELAVVDALAFPANLPRPQ